MNIRMSVLIAIALIASSAGANAQSRIDYKLLCNVVTNNPPEPIGDRDDHSLAVAPYSCVTEGGPMAGSVVTGRTIWEYDRSNARALTGNGVMRKSGAIAAFENTMGEMKVLLKEGKLASFKGSGKGRFVLAAGTGAPLAGKTYGYTLETTGALQFKVDVKVD